MNEVSEVIQTVGAILLFSLVLNTSNRHMFANTERLVNSEIENQAVTLAQDYLEYSKSLPFDDATVNDLPDQVPGDFTMAPLPATTAQSLSDMVSLNDFNGYIETVNGGSAEFTISVSVDYVSGPDFTQSEVSQTRHKRISIEVVSESLRNPVSLEYVRTYSSVN